MMGSGHGREEHDLSGGRWSLLSNLDSRLRPPELQSWAQDLLTVLMAVQGDPRLEWDSLRFAISLQELSTVIDEETQDVLELGGQGPFSELVRAAYPDVELHHYGGDLRDPLTIPDQSFDVVVAMEVIEHVADRPMGHGLTLQGMRSILSECVRVLRVGGALFLTTPNACSAWVLQRVLLHEPPLLFEQHVRELAPAELFSLVTQSGLKIERHKCWSVWHMWDFGELFNFMERNGYETVDRGDDQFLVARRQR